MNDLVIQVEGLGKKYRIGKAEEKADTVMGTLINGLKQPFTNLRQIRNLSKLDSDEESIFWALKNVSFEVLQGDVMGIIGPNGAGKSTLLKILSRITEPNEGTVRIKGRVAALLEVGTGFHPELTGRENIFMNGTILGMRRKEIVRKLDEIVEFSGVSKYLDTPVKFYSSGMRVRLGFSVAAHLEPEVLIIDEVLSVGDAEFQKKCLGKMEDVAHEGRTVLFVSHNLNAVKGLCSRTMLLGGGKKIMIDESDKVINHYLKNIGSSYVWTPQNGEDGCDKQKIIFIKKIACSQHAAIPLDKKFSIHVQLESLESQIDPLHVNLFFKAEGETAFVVQSGQRRLENGVYNFRFDFEKDLFNNLNYQVDAMVIQRAAGVVNVKDALMIDFIDDRPLGWKGKFPGYVRPRVESVIEKL